MRKGIRFATMIICIFCVSVISVWACTTILVGKDMSTTGYVIVGHNEDDGGRAMVEHGYVPPKDWKTGYLLPAEDGRAAIPQVSHTYGFWWGQVKPASGGFSNADGFLNDNGVFCVSNSCANSKIDTKDPSRLTDGGIEYNLRRVVAERATSARHGVQIIIEMVETYGYAPSGRAYTVADADEAWMVQIFSGKHYVALRCPDDEVVVFPNHYTVHDLSDYDEANIMYSDGLIRYAKQNGFYEEVDGKFDFAKSFQAPGTYKSAGNTYRQEHGMSMILGKEWDEDYYPFSVKPSIKISPEAVMEILSTHYEGTYDDPAYLRAEIPGGAPHDTTLRRICTGTTVESTVCQFDAKPLYTTLWTAFGRPCELPFIPLHPLAGVPKELDQLKDPASALESHLLPDPTIAAHENSGWQEFRDFQNTFEMVYEENIALLTRLNQSNMLVMKNANAAAVKAAKEDEGNASSILAQAQQKAVSDSLALLKDFSKTLNIVEITKITKLSISSPQENYTLTFKLSDGSTPIESTIRLGLGFTNTRTQYVAPIEGSLKKSSGKRWQVSFSGANLVRYISSSGSYDYFLGGRTTSGTSFAGMTLLPMID